MKKGEIFAIARDRAAKTEYLGTAWPRYRDFEVEERNGGVYVYAPFRPKSPTGRAHTLLPEDLNLLDVYDPLRKEPQLFLKFARLARKGPLSPDEMLEVVLDWVRRYGVLGLEGVDYLETPGYREWGTGRRESLSAFAGAVREAARCLSLYEAASMGGHAGAAALEECGIPGRTTAERRERAYEEAGNIVADHVERECYPRLYRNIRKDTGETAGFAQGWGFRSLLGAMYLQMMWLMVQGTSFRPCKGPGCPNTITFEKNRKDKEFCSKKCKERWRYHYVVKPKKQETSRR